MIDMITIGVDEAGRGPVIGPLVVCSVAIPRDDCKMLTDRGVKDSKDLSASKFYKKNFSKIMTFELNQKNVQFKFI